MDEREVKKLLIDLGLTWTDIANTVGITSWGVQRYFRGELRNAERRAQIMATLRKRARQKRMRLPKIW